MDPGTLERMPLGSWGEWAGAAGSIIAAVVALWIATRRQKPRVRLEASTVVEDDPASGPAPRQVIHITVDNQGHALVRVRSVAIEVGFPRANYCRIVGRMPTLDHGDRWRAEADPHDVAALWAMVPRPRGMPRRIADALGRPRLVVTIATGDRYRCRVSDRRRVIKRIAEALPI